MLPNTQKPAAAATPGCARGPICDACETVSHCSRHGCIPIQSSAAKLAYEGPEPDECGSCAGTGEGQFDGDRCVACNGRATS